MRVADLAVEEDGVVFGDGMYSPGFTPIDVQSSDLARILREDFESREKKILERMD